jgi:hypothetical protein
MVPRAVGEKEREGGGGEERNGQISVKAKIERRTWRPD